MSIFGWSYPPGAAGDPYAPYNQEEGPCEVCGHAVDSCICPECPVCGSCGDPACYADGDNAPGHEDHGLTRNQAQLDGITRLEEIYMLQAEADAAEYKYWADPARKSEEQV